MEGFLGTGASFGADITLIAYILLIAPVMIIGFVFARRKMFIPHHKYAMTAVVIVNWVLILLVMQISYRNGVAPYTDQAGNEPSILIPMIHLLSGGIAQILATWLVIMMWTENTGAAGILPNFLRTTNIKPWMRLTLALWLLTVVLGIGIYFTWYTPSASPSDLQEPVSTQEAIAPEATEEAQVEATDEPAEGMDDQDVTPTEGDADENNAEDSGEVSEPQATEEPADEPNESASAESDGEMGEPQATEDAVVDETTEEPAATEEALPEPASTEEASG